MSRPRQVLPGQFYLVNRRCTQRMFLLRPDEITNNAFAYCLAEAAKRHQIDILLPMAEANHHHTVIFDRHGHMPLFLEHFHKMLARCLNARWGRWENLWSAEEVCVVRLLDRETVLDKLVYAATNPVKDNLVDQVVQWPGTNGYRLLITGDVLCARRPPYFFRDDGAMPAEVELRLVIPPELGARDDVIAELRARVAAFEHAHRTDRLRTGRRVLGRRRVLAQSWRESPASVERRRTLRPRFAGGIAARVVALLAFREFLALYRDARDRWLAGLHAEFPAGTYWLARFARISVAPLPTA
jgi:putative transposase